MGEMKSAFERAMERAEKMGTLSAEEMKQRRIAELTPVGQAIAQRYLEHGHETLLREEIDKNRSDERVVVLSAALTTLVEAISLADNVATERALKGVLALIGEEMAVEATALIEQIALLLQRFNEDLERRFQGEKENIERADMELLHQLRISGSAVGPINMAANEAWGAMYRDFSKPFQEELQLLKTKLIEKLAV